MALDTIEITVDGKLFSDFDQVSEEIAGVAMRALDDATPLLRGVTREFMDEVMGKLQSKHGAPWRWGGSGDHLFTRSGQGLRDIAASIKVEGRGADVTGTFRLSGYMAVQETGATITPKRSKYLTIPLPAAMNSRGIQLKRSAREWSDTFVARSKRGSLLVFQKRGRSVVPLYVLKSSVTLRPRLRLEEAVNAALPYYEQRVFEQLSRALGA